MFKMFCFIVVLLIHFGGGGAEPIEREMETLKLENSFFSQETQDAWRINAYAF